MCVLKLYTSVVFRYSVRKYLTRTKKIIFSIIINLEMSYVIVVMGRNWYKRTSRPALLEIDNNLMAVAAYH